ncbi:NUDIX domain-containing protein, partial [Neobacillus kokaensis]|uniref:NUDIX domain-containing protein n=1 Tax=Neobacillus kokaensis TaxID=2759023 RepID=UPI001749FC96
MSILVSKKGNVFLDFLQTSEEEINKYVTDAPLTHSLVVAKYQEKYLLIFNKWRQNWELAGGIIDDGETPRECAIRELFEETYQSIKQLSFKGFNEVSI